MVTPVWKNPGKHPLFANWAYVHVCRYRGWGGTSEKRWKQGFTSLEKLKLKEVKSEMMTGGSTMHLVLEIKFIISEFWCSATCIHSVTGSSCIALSNHT